LAGCTPLTLPNGTPLILPPRRLKTAPRRADGKCRGAVLQTMIMITAVVLVLVDGASALLLALADLCRAYRRVGSLLSRPFGTKEERP
jgi:hypothetical protein